jgi:adenosylmethionine-8-amino-7-oxononanoate aminotransferase
VNTTPAVVATAPLWSAQAHIPSIAGQQLIITRGDGNYVYTDDGRRLFDGTAGLWHANVGHCRPELISAATEQMQRLETYHTFGRFTNDRAIELSHRLAQLSPIEDPKIVFNSGGSDAIDVACKLARRFWQLEGRHEKTVILSREFGYHGLHAFGTSIAGLSFNREGYGTESLIPETARVPVADVNAIAATIAEIGAERIAAIVTEPVQGTGGVNPPPPGYFTALNKLAAENDILLIADEVITGFGRTGTMFATSRYGITPDIITFAKGVTSGYAPLGGILIAPRLWEPFFIDADSTPIFRHGTTYSGHATCCAVALKNLDLLDELDLLARVVTLEDELSRSLADLSSHELVEDVRVAGLLGGVTLSTDIDANAVVDRLIDRGFISRALRGNNLQFSPPFTTETSEVHGFVSAVRETLDETS